MARYQADPGRHGRAGAGRWRSAIHAREKARRIVNARAPSARQHPRANVQELLEEISHILPEQAPLQCFVHHNTLHSFEHMPFERGVVEGAKILSREPFPREDLFAEWLSAGRIRAADL